MTKKRKPSSDRPHYVDENTETVYLSANGWSAAVSAPFWANKFFPGYKCVILSHENLQKKIKEDNTDA